MAREVSRRRFLGTTSLAVSAAATAACAPAAAPVTAPATPPGAPAVPAVDARWEQAVAAAKQEGKLSIITQTGTGFRKALDAFQEVFPGITVEHRTFSVIGLSVPVVIQERNAGVYSFDLVVGSPTIALGQYRPQGALHPVKPDPLRADVSEDKAWAGGFEAGWMDNDRQFCYAFGSNLSGFLAIDTNQVKEGEIKNVRDLLDPKWRGRMMFADVRQGSTWGPLSATRTAVGEDFIRKLLLDQQVAYQRETRPLTEAVVRGTYPIVLGATLPVLSDFQSQGLGKNVKLIEVQDLTYVTFSSAIARFERAPHPNAAAVFVNWLLGKEGQTAWAQNVQVNSRRVDVPPFDPQLVPQPGGTYYRIGPEAGFSETDRTQKFLADLVGIKN